MFGCSQEVGEGTAGSADPLNLGVHTPLACPNHDPVVTGFAGVAVHGLRPCACPALMVNGTKVFGMSAWKYVRIMSTQSFSCDPSWRAVVDATFGARASTIAVASDAPAAPYCIYTGVPGATFENYMLAASNELHVPFSAISPVMDVKSDWQTDPGAGQCPSCKPTGTGGS